jgi:hypothetical protein
VMLKSTAMETCQDHAAKRRRRKKHQAYSFV